MPIVKSNIDISKPQQQIFALAQDYRLRFEWDPFLKEMKFLDDAYKAAKGVQVWVKAWNGFTMTVKYITLNEPEYVAMKMIEGRQEMFDNYFSEFLEASSIFSKFAGTWKFEELMPGNTRVTFKYSFSIKLKMLAFILDPVVKLLFTRDIKARLTGLKNAAENTDILKRLTAEYKIQSR